MNRYAAFCLGLRSAIPLPELARRRVAIDAEIELSRDPIQHADRRVITPTEAWLPFTGIGTFHISNGRKIVVRRVDGVDDRAVRLPLLGSALALLLEQRGRLVLHASSVAVGGRAVGFLGGSGWGKSTTAGALIARGHPFLSDDLLAIDVDGADGPVVLPGFPQMKLWPDAAAALGLQFDALSRVHPAYDKRAHRSDLGFSHLPVPLEHLYVLERGDRERVRPLTPHEAMAELIRHTYSARFLGFADPGTHFDKCAQLLRHVAVWRLEMPHDLSSLSALARRLEEHLGYTSSVPSGNFSGTHRRPDRRFS